LRRRRPLYLAYNSFTTLVSQLKPSELVIVDKIDGETRIKRFSDSHIKNIRMDEAWINNLLEGGLPW